MSQLLEYASWAGWVAMTLLYVTEPEEPDSPDDGLGAPFMHPKGWLLLIAALVYVLCLLSRANPALLQ